MNNELIAAQREVRIQEAIIVKQDELIAVLRQGIANRDARIENSDNIIRLQDEIANQSGWFARLFS